MININRFFEKYTYVLISLCVLLHICTASTCFAERAFHPILVEFNGCNINAQNTSEVYKCRKVAYEAWDRELNKVYGELMSSLQSAERKEKLKQSQRAWIAFRDKEFILLSELFSDNMGSVWSMTELGVKSDFVKNRVEQLYKDLYATNPSERAPYVFWSD